jgi:hypothetical protein
MSDEVEVRGGHLDRRRAAVLGDVHVGLLVVEAPVRMKIVADWCNPGLR